MINPATYLTYMAVVFGLFLIPGAGSSPGLSTVHQWGRQVGIATGLGVASES